MIVLRSACSNVVSVLVALVAFAMPHRVEAQPACGQLERELALLFAQADDAATLRALAPYISPAVIPSLLARARSAPQPLSFELWLAMGLSDHAAGLRAIKSSAPPKDDLSRAGRALALLALGDASETSTIANSLVTAAPADRLRIASGLSLLRASRPRDLLYKVLDDPDPEVRLLAAESMIRLRSVKARRVLIDLARGGPDGLRSRSAKALGSSRYAGAVLDDLPAAVFARAQVRLAAKGRADALRRARISIGMPSAEQRAGAFAALAISRVETGEGLLRLAQRTLQKLGSPVEAELAMALALMGQPTGAERLAALEPAAASNAVQVLWAFAAADESAGLLEGPSGAPVFAALERWLVSGALSDVDAARAIDAAAHVGHRRALALARARVLGPDGAALRAAVQVIGQLGEPDDVRLLIEAAHRVGSESRLELYRAAYHRCAG